MSDPKPLSKLYRDYMNLCVRGGMFDEIYDLMEKALPIIEAAEERKQREKVGVDLLMADIAKDIEAEQREGETCAWELQTFPDGIATDCGQEYDAVIWECGAGLHTSGYRFCPWCGRRIEVQKGEACEN